MKTKRAKRKADSEEAISDPEAEAVVVQIKKYHRIGSDSLAAPANKEGRLQVADEEAAQRGLTNTDYLRKARAFADPMTGYNTSELAELCQSIRENYRTFTARKARFGWTHVIALLSVPKARRQRAALQTRMFAAGWSFTKLKAEIRSKFRHRRRGGRRRWVGHRPADALVVLTELCESWTRWTREMTRRTEAGERPHLGQLSEQVKTAVGRITREVEALRAIL